MKRKSTPATLRRTVSALALMGATVALAAGPAFGQEAQWKYYPKAPEAPAGAPNVLLFMTDDVGFAASSTFGGPVPTPTLDKLAKNGLRYNAFHTTAMCSPTRAALLTGRNHHAVGSGSISDVSLDEAGYTSVIPKSAATIGRVLKLNGYDTSFFGKNHNTPVWENTAVGPFDNWPNAWGFDYFYGFNAPFADQFNPDLIENRNPVRPPDETDYILDRDLADHMIHWLEVQHTLRPDHPFFAYFASGSTHAPHMAPKEWIAKFKGQFDQGWDKVREESFERQKKLGVIPADAVLTPRPDSIPSWDSMSPDIQEVYARMMEVAAAQLAYVDYQFGRVIETLRESGELDNTMVIYIQGDNGASEEDYKGSNQELRVIAGIDGADAALKRDIDRHGGPEAFGNYPSAWAWTTNAPFQWGKRVASHLGGLRDGMVISWPAGIKQVGQIRTQFTHVIDVAPTIYEASHITPPKMVDGAAQQPIDGISMVYSFDNAKARERHHEQYFEMLGNRAYYKDGWMASTIPGRAPWDNATPADPYKFKWALYDLTTDWSQSKDVSAENPRKLAELEADFDKAAKKYHVYPLNIDLLPRMSAKFRPGLFGNRTSFTYYPGDTRYTGYAMPATGLGWTITASVGVQGDSANGPVLVQGDHFGGHALVLDRGRPKYIYNVGDLQHMVEVQAPDPLSPGRHEITVNLGAGSKRGTSVVDILVDGKSVVRQDVDYRVGGRGTSYVGRAGIAPLLNGGYRLPLACSCDIASVTLKKTDAN
jgi:arylsulfatase A-like enzyme